MARKYTQSPYKHLDGDGIIREYLALQERLGRQPRGRDDRILRYHAEKHFGSWNEMVKAAGNVPLWDWTQWTREDLMAQYHLLKSHLGRQPTCHDSPMLTMRRRRFWKTWNDFARACGDTPRKFKWSREGLLNVKLRYAKFRLTRYQAPDTVTRDALAVAEAALAQEEERNELIP